MTTKIEAVLEQRSDIHSIGAPTLSGIEQGLDNAFRSPKERISLSPGGIQLYASTIASTTLQPLVIRNGWYDLSSLTYSMDVRVVNHATAGTDKQPADYDGLAAAPLTHIALQNGGQLFNQFGEITISLCNNTVWSSKYGWIWDMISKLTASTEATNSINLIEGYTPDVDVADSRLTANSGYGARANMIRATTAAATALPVRFTGRVNIPFFAGNKRLVYLRDADDFRVSITINDSASTECLELGAAAVAGRVIDILSFEIDKYHPSAVIEKGLIEVMQKIPQTLSYQDTKIFTTQVKAATNDSFVVTLPKGKIDAIIVGFQLPAAVNKRQFTPCNIETIQVDHNSQLVPRIPYKPNYALPKQQKWFSAYLDFMRGMGELADNSSAILTPAMWLASQTLYFFDLRTNNSGVPEKASIAEDGRRSDTVTINTTYTAATTANMYVLVMSAGQIKYYIADGSMEYMQGCAM